MHFERLRMTLLFAALTVALLPIAVGQGQEASTPAVADPAASPNASNSTAPTVDPTDESAASPDALASGRNPQEPTGKTRPTIKGNSQGWLPIHIVAENDSDREAIVADLNAAGFDAIDEKFYPSNRGYILAAPRPTGTWEESLALVKDILRKNSGTLMQAPPPDYSTAPHSFTSVKWKPKHADAETRERELQKVVDALAGSDLPLRHIGHDLRRDGSNYLWVIYSSSAADDVEAFVRRVVEEPAIWPPNSILLPEDESPALHALQPPTDEPASRPRGMSISGIPVRLGSEVTIGLPSEGDRSTIRRTLESEGYDIADVDEESTWTIYLPSEADIEASVARVHEVVGPTVKVKNPDAFDMPVANIERAVRRPVSIWFFTWTPENQDRAKQEPERRRVQEAFLKSGLGVERIHWRGGGADRVRAFVASPPDKIPQIEELVHTLVKEPKFWRPPQWDKYLAERKIREPAQAASRPAPGGVPEPSPSASPVDPATLEAPSAEGDPAASVARRRPRVTPNVNGWRPIQVFVKNDVARADFVRKLNEARFDAVEVSESETWPAHIAVAPIPDVPPEESERRLRVIVEKATIWGSAEPSPPRPDSIHLFSSFKWKPNAPRSDSQKADLTRVVDRLVDSGLPITDIQHNLRPDGTNWVTVIYEREAVSEVEALVREIVENVTLWPSRHVVISRPDTKLPAEGPEPPGAEAEATPQSPKFAIRVLAMETNWERARDPDAASRLAHSTSRQVVDMKKAGLSLFPPGKASVFEGDEAEAFVDQMEAIGLIRQTFEVFPGEQPKEDADFAALGGVNFRFFDHMPDGEKKETDWTVLVVSRDRLQEEEEEEGSASPLNDSPTDHRLSLVAVNTMTDASEPGLHAGAFNLRSDQSAVVPLELPGFEGLVVLVSPVREPGEVRSLSARSGKISDQAIESDRTVSWADLNAAFGAGPTETESVAEGSLAAEITAAPAKASASPFEAKVLLIETDWRKASDPGAASRLAHSLSNRVFDDNRAGLEAFPPGYAKTFSGHEGRRITDDLQRLGLVRQSLSLSPVDLNLRDKGIEALGSAVATFQERSADGKRQSVVWNVLVVARPARPEHRIGVVSWKERTAAKSHAQEDVAAEAVEVVPPLVDVAPEESERYVGTFGLSTDQSAIVPLALPGMEGSVIVIGPARNGPAVRSLGPRGGVLQESALMADFSVDWEDLIRAYHASPTIVAATKARMEALQAAGESAEGGETVEVALFWGPAQEGQVDVLEKSLKERFPQAEVVLTQSQGEQGATLAFRAPAGSAEAIAKAMEAIAMPMVPVGGTLKSTISPISADPQAAEEADDERSSLVFRLENAASDEVAKLLDALKLDPAIRVVSDPRTNSILLSAPNATKYKHVQAVIDLLKELDRPAEATPAVEKNAPQSKPDGAANVAKIRSELARVEGDVQRAAENARSASGSERSQKVDDLRQVVARAFDLRLKLQREEAAELRDRLTKIEENLARRERIQGAVIDRRIEVLLDPALEWSNVAEDNALSPAPVAVSPASAVLTSSLAEAEPFDLAAVSSLKGFEPSDARGDAFAAATQLALQIADLSQQASAVGRAGAPDGSEVKLAMILRQAQLLRQEFEARAQAIDQESEAAKAKVAAAEARYERFRTLHDTGAVSQEEVTQAEADLRSAKSELYRQEILRRRYDEARSAMDAGNGAYLQSIPAPPSTNWFPPDPATAWAPPSSVPTHSSSGQPLAPSNPSTARTTANEAPAAPLPDSGIVPKALQGVWRTVRSFVGGQELKHPATGFGGETEWRFYGPYAFVHYEDNDSDSVSIYRVVVDPSATPSRMELHPVGLPFEDYAHIENIRPTHYLYAVEGERLSLATRDWEAHPELGYPEKLGPAPGVSYTELHRVDDAEAVVPVDEGAPAGNREKWTRPDSMNIESWRRDDQFSIATSLALRLAELVQRIRTLEQEQGSSQDTKALASARSSFELLGEEFDARERAAQRQLATAADSLKISEARLRSVQQAHEAGKTSEETKARAPAFGGALGNAQTDVQSQRDEVAFLEGLVGHYARARGAFESAAPGSVGDTPAADVAPDLPVAPSELLGTWRMTKHEVHGAPDSKVPATTWVFEGATLTWKRKGLPEVVELLEFRPEAPGEFLSFRISKLPGGREMAERGSRYRYEIREGSLQVIKGAGDGRSLPKAIAPAPGVVYFEFQRVADDAEATPPAATDGRPSDVAMQGGEPADVPTLRQGTPDEIVGPWQLTNFDAQNAPVKPVFTKWTFDGQTLHSDVTVRPGGDRYATVFPADQPGTFEAYAYDETPEGRVLRERVLNVRYEVEGNTLRTAFGRVDQAPEKVAPAEGVIYYEFERDALRPYNPLVPTESQEAVAEPELVQQARKIAESLKAKEQAIQEKKDHYASISPAEATAPGVKKTIEIYESEAVALRDRLREMQFYVARMADAALARAQAVPADESERRTGEENEAHRFAQVAETVREVVTSAGVETKPDWRPAVRADEWEPSERHARLHEDYRRARERQKSLESGSEERRLAQERVDWVVRTARDVRGDIARDGGIRKTTLTQVQDAYFAAEKKLEETRSRVATLDELEAAELELARNAYVVERTRQILDAVAKREAELNTLLQEIVSDEAETPPLKLEEATAPQSESEIAPERSSSTTTAPSGTIQVVDEPEEVLAP
ncbi:MAG TPA: secretin N-terminal domain-containing protein [Pirellulaceae bacterium]|nr:secretin N-terminal domain-containing protein [Pirellulaceae bacterium]